VVVVEKKIKTYFDQLLQAPTTEFRTLLAKPGCNSPFFPKKGKRGLEYSRFPIM
jgi:hypothetical protein